MMRSTTGRLVLSTILVSGTAGFGYASTQLNVSNNTVLQSSMAHEGRPRRAVDGNTSSLWSSNSCTHTQLEDYPYFSVDLGGVRTVDSITITNRLGACNNVGVHPNYDVCNPGTFQGKRWFCEANPDLPATGQYSCGGAGWIECLPGCNPGVFQGQHWRCPDDPETPTGSSCAEGWRVCDPSACSERLDAVEVWVGDFVGDSVFNSVGPGQFIGSSDVLRSYLDGPVPRQCNNGEPVYISAGQQTLEVDCHGAQGGYLYIAKRRDDSVLSLCEVGVNVL